ncbi:hypothetical protein ACLB2K_042761 [Fragaria x ananassa]
MATGSLVPLLLLARISGLLVAVLVLIWTFSFRSSFHHHSTDESFVSFPQQDQGTTYSALHPLFMVIGFILLSGEAILIHRWLPGSRSSKKSVHLCLQGVALCSGIFGIWTKFQGQRGVVANFYSLHSWMGLVCILLFGAQRGSAHGKAKGVALTHLPGALHIWFGSGYCRNWASGEVDILANKEECV